MSSVMIICTSAVGHFHTALPHAANEGVHSSHCDTVPFLHSNPQQIKHCWIRAHSSADLTFEDRPQICYGVEVRGAWWTACPARKFWVCHAVWGRALSCCNIKPVPIRCAKCTTAGSRTSSTYRRAFKFPSTHTMMLPPGMGPHVGCRWQHETLSTPPENPTAAAIVTAEVDLSFIGKQDLLPLLPGPASMHPYPLAPGCFKGGSQELLFAWPPAIQTTAV